MTIRLAVVHDLPRITEIYNEAILTTTATFDLEVKTVEDRRTWFTSHGARHPVWVLVNEAAIVVGWSCISPWSERGAYAGSVSLSLYIESRSRGLGGGRMLLDVIDRKARELGFHCLLAGISEGNEASVRLHEKFGFRLAGTLREVGHKFGRFHDVYLFQKILNHT